MFPSYRQNLKRQAARREQFTGNNSVGSLLPPGGDGGIMTSSPHTASVLLADEAKAAAASRRANGTEISPLVYLLNYIWRTWRCLVNSKDTRCCCAFFIRLNFQ